MRFIDVETIDLPDNRMRNSRLRSVPERYRQVLRRIELFQKQIKLRHFIIRAINIEGRFAKCAPR